MSITTQTGTRLVSEVRHTAKFARRDAGGRLTGTDEVSWVAVDDLVPASLAASMAIAAVDAAAPQIEAAAAAAFDAWFEDNAVALPEPLPDQLASDYLIEIREAMADGRLPSDGVFVLPRPSD